jgi:hypothetical protein
MLRSIHITTNRVTVGSHNNADRVTVDSHNKAYHVTVDSHNEIALRFIHIKGRSCYG